MPPRTRQIIARLDQLSALASPVRQEVLDVLARVGTASLGEVAAALGRPADGLYYHVRALQKVGLVHAAGSRTRAGRREALVRAAAPEFTLRYAASPPRQARAVNAIIGGMLRLGARDFRRALAADSTVLGGPARDLWALRTIGWLTPAELPRVNRSVYALSRSLSRPRGKGRLYAITVLLTPLDHRPGGPARKAPKRKPTPRAKAVRP